MTNIFATERRIRLDNGTQTDKGKTLVQMGRRGMFTAKTRRN